MEAQARPAQRAPSAAAKEPRRRRDDLILDALERLLAEVPMRELDVEAIAAEAGITRTRFYAYFTSKNDALAALLRRMGGILATAYEYPGSWFAGRPPHVEVPCAEAGSADLYMGHVRGGRQGGRTER